MQSLLNDDGPLQHGHATREVDRAGLLWGEFNLDRLVERQGALDLQRGHHDFRRARVLRRPKEGQAQRRTRTHTFAGLKPSFVTVILAT